MLCSACNDVFAGTSARTASPLRIRTHHPILQSFRASVSAGCHMCSLISTSDGFLPDPASADYHDRMKYSRIEWLFLDDELLFIERRYSESGRPFPSIVAEAIFQLIEAEKAEDAASTYVQTPTTLSDSALAVAQTWYKKCIEEHCSACTGVSTSRERFFPSRVVDVGRLGDTAVNLFNPNPPVHEPYATLSHCWGHSQTLRLVKDNIESFKEGIPLEILLKTFEQAVFVTHKIGLRYLWIDSLCILQDSADDWRAESAMMRHIYRNRALNIPDLVARRAPGAYYVFNGDAWDREVELAPLNARGWVLQERALAPRILHFGPSQLYWQCDASFHAEMFPFDLGMKSLGPHVPRVTSSFMAYLRRLRDVTAKGGGKEWERAREEVYALWNELVNAYSATALTRAEDKLIAVQALAETMLDATGDVYVAGLWKSRLVDDVLWRTDLGDLPKGATVRRPTVWRAPSWSWASLDCRIEARNAYHYIGPLEWSGKSFVSEMASFVEGFDGAETGQLRSASLQVRGVLCRTRVTFLMKSFESPRSLYKSADKTMPWGFKMVLYEWLSETVHTSDYQMPAGTLLFPVGSPIPGTIEGLVLEAVEGEDAHFRRVAYFEADILTGTIDDILNESGVLEYTDDLGQLKDGRDVKGRTSYLFTLV